LILLEASAFGCILALLCQASTAQVAELCLPLLITVATDAVDPSKANGIAIVTCSGAFKPGVPVPVELNMTATIQGCGTIKGECRQLAVECCWLCVRHSCLQWHQQQQLHQQLLSDLSCQLMLAQCARCSRTNNIDAITCTYGTTNRLSALSALVSLALWQTVCALQL
jgi:hypothetical protein